MSNHIPLTSSLELSTIGVLLGVYTKNRESMYGDRDNPSRHALYKLQLIEKDPTGQPFITEKGQAYLRKLADATYGITLTPQMTRVEWV